MGKDPHKKPVTGRVVGVGNGAKWKVHYPDTLTRDERRERRQFEKSGTESARWDMMKAELLHELQVDKAKTEAEAKAAVIKAADGLMAVYAKGVQAWVEKGCVGPMPQFSSSLVGASNANSSVDGETSPGQAHHSSPSVSCGTRASPRPDLDALKVSVTHAQQINCAIIYLLGSL